MINIADNHVVREQVKRVARDPVAPKDPSALGDQLPVSPAYPAESMVLEGGRYYTVTTEK